MVWPLWVADSIYIAHYIDYPLLGDPDCDYQCPFLLIPLVLHKLDRYHECHHAVCHPMYSVGFQL